MSLECNVHIVPPIIGKSSSNVISLADRRKKKNATLKQRSKSLYERCSELEELTSQLVEQNVDLSREVESLRLSLLKLLRCLKEEAEARRRNLDLRKD